MCSPINQPLLTTDRLNTEGLKALAMNTMMINPQVEVYLLNAKGDILGHALPEAAVVAGRVDLAPVRRFLALSAQEASPGPIYGQNPRQPEQSAVFSAAAVEGGRPSATCTLFWPAIRPAPSSTSFRTAIS